MLFFSSALIVEVASSTRSARVTVLPHALQLKASLCSLGQSSSNPRRIKCSPHPLHSRTICPEGSIVRSNNFSDGPRVSVIPLLLVMVAPLRRTIELIRVGHMSPWDYPLLTTQGEQP